MDLAINGLRLVGPRCGVGRYVEYLLRYWTAQTFFERITVYAPRPIEVELPSGAELCVLPPRSSNAVWEQISLPRAARRHDLLFCPSYVVPPLACGRVVVTHLGSYEALPEAFGRLERWKSRVLYQMSARRADRVITVSESSKRDIVRFYGVPRDKVNVIPLGVGPDFRPLGDDSRLAATRRRWLGADRPFILFVGKLSQRRHIPELIAAFAKLKQSRNLPHALLLIGPASAVRDVSAVARAHGVGDDVVHHGFAGHDALPLLYNAASLFIYPSAYEGFGIPVLEAMACGTPTVALRNSSFLEFADGVALLAPDGREASLLEAMQVMLFSPHLRLQARRAGPERARAYSWADIAQRTMTVLADVAASSPAGAHVARGAF